MTFIKNKIFNTALVFFVLLISTALPVTAGIEDTVKWQRDISNKKVAFISQLLGGGTVFLIKQDLYKVPSIALSTPFPKNDCIVTKDNPSILKDFRISVTNRDYSVHHQVLTMKAYCLSKSLALFEIIDPQDNEKVVSLFKVGNSVEVFVEKDDDKPMAFFNLLGFSEQNDALMSIHDEEKVKQIYTEAEKAKREYKAKNEKFIIEMAEKEGVMKTESGLLYKITRQGDDNIHPTLNSKVTVHIFTHLINGSEFGNGAMNDKTFTFDLRKLNSLKNLSGYVEGLQLMTVGSKYTFYIPSELAYGEKGTPTIPGDSTVIFDVELISIN